MLLSATPSVRLKSAASLGVSKVVRSSTFPPKSRSATTVAPGRTSTASAVRSVVRIRISVGRRPRAAIAVPVSSTSPAAMRSRTIAVSAARLTFIRRASSAREIG